MNRPWLIFSILGLSLLAGLAAMGWISAEIVRLDRNEREARMHAAVEENVRLALWRMDSFLAPLIAQESARPYFHYSAFYPAERAYTRMYAEIQADEVLIPSPLLTFESPYVHLHFQIAPDGTCSSPQTPMGNMRDLAEVGNYRTGEQIRQSQDWLSKIAPKAKDETWSRQLPAPIPQIQTVLTPYGNDFSSSFGSRASPLSQQRLNQQEQASRSQMASNTMNFNSSPQTQALMPTPVNESPLHPLWLDDELLLARRVTIEHQQYIQGCWLDWETIRPQMLASIKDLLPNAQLQPVSGKQAPPDGDTHRLASLPATLLPGTVPADLDATPSPIGRSLTLAWVAALIACLLAAIVLWQTLSLSERRGAFVSAVTHELRTPLTTFRLYTDLLTQHPEAPVEKRTNYLSTLRREADRLAHLVENVLAYARLERKSVSSRMETHPLTELVERYRERLSERAAQAEMKLDVHGPSDDARLQVRVDPGILEQILFNLVDNASKYAANGADARLCLELARDGERAVVRVRDHGPGISAEEARRLFQPFSKSVRQAALSAPGVGLGLALSRRLARQMGGELSLEPPDGKGACFKLSLPCVPS